MPASGGKQLLAISQSVSQGAKQHPVRLDQYIIDGGWEEDEGGERKGIGESWEDAWKCVAHGICLICIRPSGTPSVEHHHPTAARCREAGSSSNSAMKGNLRQPPSRRSRNSACFAFHPDFQ